MTQKGVREDYYLLSYLNRGANRDLSIVSDNENKALTAVVNLLGIWFGDNLVKSTNGNSYKKPKTDIFQNDIEKNSIEGDSSRKAQSRTGENPFNKNSLYLDFLPSSFILYDEDDELVVDRTPFGPSSRKTSHEDSIYPPFSSISNFTSEFILEEKSKISNFTKLHRNIGGVNKFKTVELKPHDSQYLKPDASIVDQIDSFPESQQCIVSNFERNRE